MDDNGNQIETSNWVSEPAASLPSKSESEQLNPFPAKPITPPPAHYFARELPSDQKLLEIAEQNVHDRMRKYDEIANAVHYGKWYLDGQFDGYCDGEAGNKRIVPQSGLMMLFPDDAPESYIIKEHESWCDGYADGYDVGVTHSHWMTECSEASKRNLSYDWRCTERQIEIQVEFDRLVGERDVFADGRSEFTKS